MKRWLRYLGISLLTLLFIYSIIGFFILPNIIKEQVILNAQDALKRKISLESVSLNPLTFSISLHGFVIYGKNGEDSFAGAREIEVNVDPLNYFFGELKLTLFEATAPFVRVHKKKDGSFNFSDLMGSQGNKDSESSEPVSLPNIHVEKFAIKNGEMSIRDDTGESSFQEVLRPINFTLRDFSTGKGHSNQLSMYVQIDNGGYIDYRGAVNSLEPLLLEGELKFHSGRLYTQWKYFQDQLDFIVADGALDASLQYSANLSTQPVEVDINKYELKIDRLHLQDKASKQSFLKVPEFVLQGSASLHKEHIKVNEFAIRGVRLDALRDEKGKINLLTYLPQTSSTGDKEGNMSEPSSWKVDLAKVQITTEEVSFSDHYPPQAYVAGWKALQIGVNDINVQGSKILVPDYQLGIDGMYLKEGASVNKPVVSLKNFHLNGSYHKDEAQKISLERIELNKLDIKAALDKRGVINFAKYSVEETNAPTPESGTEASVLNWEVKEIALKDTRLDFRDRFNAHNGHVNLDQINLSVKDLNSQKGSWATSKLSMKINEKGVLKLDSKIRQTPFKLQSSLDLKGLELAKFQPFVDKRANVDINSGLLHLDFRLEHDDKQTKLLANTHIDEVDISERKEGKKLFGFERLRINNIDFSLNPDHVKIAEVDIYKPYARMKIDQNQSSNLDGLMVEQGQKTKEVTGVATEAQVFPVFIGKVNFKDGTGEFSDLSLPLPFSTKVHELNGEMIALGTLEDIKTSVNVDGTVDQYGLMKIEGSLLSAAPKEATDIRVKFENIDMTNLSAYTGKFIGYKLEEGKMNVGLGYKVMASELKGSNRIVLKQMNLGQEVESEEAISAPVGLAIALLKDSEGVIDLDVPVSGNVDAPEFAIGQVVWTAFKNLIVGVATAPFRFLGDMLGVSAEELENVAFEDGKIALMPPQKEKLDKLSEALKSKKLLVLKVAGSYDNERDLYALKKQAMLDETLSRVEDKQTVITKMGRDELQDLFELLYEEHFGAEALKGLKTSVEAKELQQQAEQDEIIQGLQEALIADQKLAPGALNHLARERAEQIVSHLQAKGVEAQQLKVLPESSVQAATAEYIPLKLELGAK